MTAQIIDFVKVRNARAACNTRRAVSDYFAEHSYAMSWLFS
jgi:hypothetical protein